MTNLSHNSAWVSALDLEVAFQQGFTHLEPGKKNLSGSTSVAGALLDFLVAYNHQQGLPRLVRARE